MNVDEEQFQDLALLLTENVITSFGDVSLRGFDLASVTPGQWLTDNVIAYDLAKLDAKAAAAGVQLFDPSVSYLLRFGGDDVISSVIHERSRNEHLQHTPTTTALAFVINDNTNVERARGGTHWSVLVFEKSKARFTHFDSIPGSNETCARELAMKLAPHLVADHQAALASKEFIKEHEFVPRQQNAHDCGIFTLLNIHELVEYYELESASSTIADDHNRTASDIRTLNVQTELQAQAPDFRNKLAQSIIFDARRYAQHKKEGR